MLCQFGPVTVLFQNIPSHLFWPFWSWKLDPFRVESGVPDVVVDYSGQQIVPKCVPVYEKCGKVCRQIFILDEGTIIWQQKESLEGQLQVQFSVSAEWSRITINQDNSPTAGMAAFEALTFLIYYVFIRKQVLTFHGAIVEEGGRGFLLCADSGVGKTTHARLWRDNKNALIINGDRAACVQKQGKWIGFGTPWCGTSGEYLNRCVPLQAVVILKRGEENRICKASGVSLLSNVVYPAWDSETTEIMLTLLDGFLKSVPVLQLECIPEISAVDVLYQALEDLDL